MPTGPAIWQALRRALGLSVIAAPTNTTDLFNAAGGWTIASSLVGSSSTTQILFNNAGSVSGAAGLIWDFTNGRFTVTGLNSAAASMRLYAPTGQITGALFQILDGAGSPNECFRVDANGNVTFTNSATCRYITLTHPTTPEIYFTSSAYTYITGPSSGTGFSQYFLRNFTATTTVSMGFYKETSPASIGSSQNNYALSAGTSFYRLTSSGAFDITGIAAPSFSGGTTGTGGYRLTLVNIGANTLTLKHESASSTAANRIIGRGAADFALTAGLAVDLIYDLTTARWRVI